MAAASSSRADNAFGDNYRGMQLGQNYGQIHIAPERPETPPKPCSNVPYRRDPHFVERATLTDQIQTKLSVPAGRAALVGLGGVGKSQLAIEYARNLRQRSPQTWVLWIHASNASRFEQSMRDIANLLKLYGRRDPKADILQLVRNWLYDESNGSWMVVLDNADDASFLLESPATLAESQATRRYIDYIPSCEHGSVLITTRSQSEALKLVYESEKINVLPMSEEEAEALLVSTLECQSFDNRLLVRALDYVPLAITQAAAYIRERGALCSVRQYYERIEQSRESRISLLRRHISLPSRDAEASNAVMLTWQISFDHISKTQKSAAELLSLMSFCDGLAIPELLIRMDSRDIDSAASSLAFEEDISTLRSFSLVSETTDPKEWKMHRLVQDATQDWLKQLGEFDEICSRFIYRLSQLFPTGNFENWSLCRELFPHAAAAAEHKPANKDAQLLWSLVMDKAAWYAREQGDYNRALTMATSSMTARLEQLGDKDEMTIHSTAIVALAYGKQGRWEEAEQLQVKVMEAKRAKLGADHPDTLDSMNNLAVTYWDQGRWEEAEQLEVKVLETRRANFGANHPATLGSIVNLAVTYKEQGRWGEAEQLEVEVMEARRAKLGADHLDTLDSMNNLAVTYGKQGRWEEAEQLQVKVMEAKRAKLGADHPATLDSMNNLAIIHREQGWWEEAEQLEVKVLETRRANFGANHPATLGSIANLAVTYGKQGRWEEAEQLQMKVIEAKRAKLGANHPATLSSMDNLAVTYRKQGRGEEAEQLQVKVMEAKRAKLGADHPDTLNSMNNLAVTYGDQGRWEEAEQLQMKVIKMRRAKIGANHPDTLQSMAFLALMFWNEGRLDEAEEWQIQALHGLGEFYGPQHPNTLTAASNLAYYQRFVDKHHDIILKRTKGRMTIVFI